MAGVRMHGAGGAGGAGGKGGGGGNGDGGNGRGGNGRGMGGNNSGILPQFYEFAKNPTTTNQVNLQEALQTKLPGSTIFGGRSKQDRWARGHIQSAMQRAAINHANMAEQARWDTSESRHRRLASRHARILESHGHFAGLTGYNINPATQAVTDYASSRLGELGGFGASYQASLIKRIGGSGVNAAFGGDRHELRKMERTLKKIEKHSEGTLKAIKPNAAGDLSAAQKEQQATHRRLLEGVKAQRANIAMARQMSPNSGSLMMGGAMGAVMDNPIGMVAAIGASPWILGAAAKTVVGMSEPYASLRTGMARLARGGGATTNGLMSAVMGYGGWAAKHGLSPDDQMRLFQEYGGPARNRTQFHRVMEAVGHAQYTAGWAGISNKTVASTLGLYKMLGIGNSRDFKAQENRASHLLTYAVSQGLNKSHVLNTMNNSLRVVAGSGGVVNKGSLINLMGALYAGGGSAMRSGQGILQTVGGLQNSMNNVMNTPATAVWDYMAMEKAGGLTSHASVKRFLGVSAYKKAMGTAWSRSLIKHNIADMKNGGNPYFAAQELTQLMSPTGYLHNVLEAGMSGYSYQEKVAALQKVGLSNQGAASLLMHPHSKESINLIKNLQNDENKRARLNRVGANKDVLHGAEYVFKRFAKYVGDSEHVIKEWDAAISAAVGGVEKFASAAVHAAKQMERGAGSPTREATMLSLGIPTGS